MKTLSDEFWRKLRYQLGQKRGGSTGTGEPPDMETLLEWAFLNLDQVEYGAGTIKLISTVETLKSLDQLNAILQQGSQDSQALSEQILVLNKRIANATFVATVCAVITVVVLIWDKFHPLTP